MVIENKKGQNMSLTTILLMVLGIVVVVLLIWGFSTGWTGFWERINPFGKDTNIDSVRSSCNLACSSGSVGYCKDPVTLKLSDGRTLKGSCDNLNSELLVSCSSVTCNAGNRYEQKCSDFDGEWKATCDTTETPKTGTKDMAPDMAKIKCCVAKQFF